MRKVIGPLLSCLSLLILSACSESFLIRDVSPPRLTVLALKANFPEVSEAELPLDIELTPLIDDRFSGGRPIQVRGQSCLDPGPGPGLKTETCENVTESVALNFPTILPASVPKDSQSFGQPRLLGAGPALKIEIPEDLLEGRSDMDRFNGVAYLIALEFWAEGQVFRISKRIIISDKPRPNQNPRLKGLHGDGLNFSTLPEKMIQLSVKFDAAAQYEFKESNGKIKAKNQNLQISYVVSDGVLQTTLTSATEEVQWSPPQDPTSLVQPVSLTGILEDGLGGVDFLVIEF